MSFDYKPIVCMMTQSDCYRRTSTMNIRGVLWHSTGANNPWLKRYVQPDDNAPNRASLLAKLGTNTHRNDWNHFSVEAGLNAWVGKLEDGSVASVQTMPWNYRPWGCGSGNNGSCNNGWVQFEICEDGLGDEYYFHAVYEEACALTAYICKEYGIQPFGHVSVNGMNVPTILCHQDSYRYGLGTNHGDIYHWFGRYGKNMDSVRQDVAKLLAGDGIVFDPAPSEEDIIQTKILQNGNYNDDVKILQKKLVWLGYDVGGIDGCFGGKTLSAVIDFQAKNGLTADGIVGPKTWAALYSTTVKDSSTVKEKTETPAKTENSLFKAGDVVSIVAGATYYTGKAVPNWVASANWIVSSVSGDRVVIDKSADGKYTINSPINSKFLQSVSDRQDSTDNAKKDISIGDIVDFVGSVHYISAGAGNGTSCKAGKAKVTQIYKPESSAHPYHLVAVPGGGSTVHGWVNADTVKNA